MTGSAEPRKIESYMGMLVGGIATLGAAGLALVIIAGFGAFSDSHIPTGWTAVSAVGCMVGSMLALASKILYSIAKVRAELEDHKADHQAAHVDVQDLTAIRTQVAEILTFIARYDLERKDERAMRAQVEEFLAWRGNAERRFAVLEGDNVIDIETMRAAHEISRHLPKGE